MQDETKLYPIIITLLIAFLATVATVTTVIREENFERAKLIEKHKLEIQEFKQEVRDLKEEIFELQNEDGLLGGGVSVIFTNYYLGDGSSGETTASGKKISDFDVNEDGFYTYEGKVVLATANTTRLNWSLKQGYRSHELYEEITFELNDKNYTGIVLDICGSCFGTSHENIQRYDIFTVGNVIGKKEGKIYGKE